jgi:creatinine amidohydrolase/Fe(II)-dependent formamide hydrolase-like protein
VRWTSTSTPTGVSGAAALATATKGEAVVEQAVSNLVDFVREFRAMDKGERVDHRVARPTLPTLPSLD